LKVSSAVLELLNANRRTFRHGALAQILVANTSKRKKDKKKVTKEEKWKEMKYEGKAERKEEMQERRRGDL
jgi:hypothetical protein